MTSPQKIPVMMVAPTTGTSAHSFNPNDWEGVSKGLIQSCQTEYGLFLHCQATVVSLCEQGRELCAGQIADVQQQWATAKFDLSRCDFFAEVPGFHVHAAAFFSAAKALLDKLAQLLSSEEIVGSHVHGFHENGDRVVRSLQRTARADRRPIAKPVETLIHRHKELWIDDLIVVRDGLLHPPRGSTQAMFRLVMSEHAAEIVCNEVIPPMVQQIPIDRYLGGVSTHAGEFITQYLALVRRPQA